MKALNLSIKLLVTMILFVPAMLYAGTVNPEFSYQGYIAPTSGSLNGNFCVQVILNQAGAPVWTKKFANTLLTNGVFNVTLTGADDLAVNLTPALLEVANTAVLSTVTVKLDTTPTCSNTYVATFAGVQLSAVPYALVAADVADAAVTAAKIANGVITNAHIAAGAAISVTKLDASATAANDVIFSSGAGGPWTTGPVPSTFNSTITAGAAVTGIAVTNNATVGGEILANGAGTGLAVVNAATIGGELTLNGAGTGLSVTNDASITGNTTMAGNLTLSGAGSSATLGGTLSVTGLSSVAALTATGLVSANAAGTGLSVLNNAIVGGDFTVTGNTTGITLATGGIVMPATATSIAQAPAATGDLTIASTNGKNIALSTGAGTVNMSGGSVITGTLQSGAHTLTGNLTMPAGASLITQPAGATGDLTINSTNGHNIVLTPVGGGTTNITNLNLSGTSALGNVATGTISATGNITVPAGGSMIPVSAGSLTVAENGNNQLTLGGGTGTTAITDSIITLAEDAATTGASVKIGESNTAAVTTGVLIGNAAGANSGATTVGMGNITAAATGAASTVTIGNNASGAAGSSVSTTIGQTATAGTGLSALVLGGVTAVANTGANTLNIGVNASTGANSETINIGTGASTTGSTAINIGSGSNAANTITVKGNVTDLPTVISSAGTVAQALFAVTGTGTAFAASMVGDTIYYSNGSWATITAVTNATTATVNTSMTVAALSTYMILPQNNLAMAPQYFVGTASQALFVVTGVGTAFSPAMVGGTIIFANGITETITGFTNTTTITVTVSQAVAGQAYVIWTPTNEIRVVSSQKIVGAGTYAPTAGTKYFMVEAVGGGGGGGNSPATTAAAGSGGGGAGYVRILCPISETYGVGVIAIGAAGASAAVGGNTTMTLVSGNIQATGGGAGVAGVLSVLEPGGAGGIPTNANTACTQLALQAGGPGTTGVGTAAIASAMGGNGGPSFLGAGVGQGKITATGVGGAAVATSFGAGGGGAIGNGANAGGVGTIGVVIITEYRSY